MKRVRIFNKIMSVVLAMVMVVSMLPMSVFATQTETEETPTEGYLLTIYNADGTAGMELNGTKSASEFSLKSAIEDARVYVNNAILFGLTTPCTYVVEMYEDSTEDESFEIGSDVTINGNGFSIVCAEGAEVTVADGAKVDAEIVKTEPAVLTLSDFVDAVIAANGNYDGEGATFVITPASGNAQTETVEGLPNRLQKYSNPEVYYAQYQRFSELTDVSISNVNFVFVPAAVTVKDAWNTAGATTTADNINGELQLMNAGSVTLTGCTFDKMSVSPISATSVTVDGCEFNDLKAYAIKDIKASTVSVTGSTFTDCSGAFWMSTAPATLTVTDNAFVNVGRRGAIQFSANGDYTNTAMDVTGNTVTGGAFLWQLNNTVTYEQVSAILDTTKNTYETAYVGGSTEPAAPAYVAKIGETGYATLAEALADAASGATITLLADVTEDIAGFENVTLTTEVAGGVTVTTTNTGWVNLNNVTIDAGVTVKSPLVFSKTGENTILGTLEVGSGEAGTYYHGYGAKTTIRDGGKVIVNGTTILRYNADAQAGIYVYGDSDASTVEYDCAYYIGAYSGTFYAGNATVECGYFLLKNSYDGATYADINLTLDNSTLTVVGTTDTQDSFIIDDQAHMTLKNGAAIADVRDFNILADTNLTLNVDSSSSISATYMNIAEGVPFEAVANSDGTYGVTVKTAVPTSTLTNCYTSDSGYWGECGGNASESFVFKFYHNDTYMGYTSLNNVGGIIDGDVYVSWNIKLDAESNTDEYWDMAWEIQPTLDMQPTRVEHWVDGVKAGEAEVEPNWSDRIFPVVAAVTDEKGTILGYVNGTEGHTLADAVANGGYITLLADVKLSDTLIIDTDEVTIDGDGHKITLDSSFANTNAWGAAIMVGNSNYVDADVANHKVTIKNVVFDGITGNSLIRAQGVELVMDGCTVQNCDSTNIDQGMLRIDATEATIQNCTFTGNKATKIIGHNHNTGSSKIGMAIDNCAFTGNTISGPGVVVLSSDAGCAIKDSEFVSNDVTCGNGATVYMGFTENNVVTGNLFKDNTVTGNASSNRIAGALFVGYTNEISGNSFVGNTATNAAGTAANSVCVDTYYGEEINLSENYWGGSEPDAVAIGGNVDAYVYDSYYTALNADGTIDETSKVVIATAVATVNGVEYTDLQEAIVAAAPSGTVELLSDVTVDKWVMISETLSIGNGNIITCVIDGLTIDGNGYTLTVNGIESAKNGDNLFFDATELNIRDLTIKYADGVSGGIGLKSGTISDVTFDGGVYAIFPQTGDVTITDCTFMTNGTSIYFEEERDGLTVTGNTFENPDEVNVILLRGDVTFTGNTVISGRTVNVVSGSPVVTGNNFNDVRFKVYNDATATIENNTINNLVFNDESAQQSTFTNNTLSESAQEALDAVTPKVAKIGDVEYGTLEEAMAAGSEIEILCDINENIAAIENVTLFTNVAGGVTITSTFEDDYVDFNNVIVKSGITLNISYVYSSGSENVIEGTLNVGATYYHSNDAKTTIQNGGKVTTGGMIVNRFHNNADSGIYVYGDGDASTVEVSCADTIGTYSGTFYAKDAVIEGKMLWLDYKKGSSEESDSYAQLNAEFENSVLNVASELRLYKDAALTLTGTAVTAGKVQVRENATPTVNMDATSSVKADAVENLAGASLNAVLGEDGTVTFKALVAEVNGVQYPTLQAAIDAAQAGETVTVLTDIELTETLEVAADKDVTLDLNGKTITYNVYRGAQEQDEAILNLGTLVIEDSSTAGTGKITSYYDHPANQDNSLPYPYPTYGSNTITNQGNLTVKGGTIECNTAGDAAFAIDNGSRWSNAKLVIEGGKVVHTVNNKSGAIRVCSTNTTYTNELVMTGGEVEGRRGITVQLAGANGDYTKKAQASVVISGGTITSTDTNAEKYRAVYSWSDGIAYDQVSITVKGDAVLNGNLHVGDDYKDGMTGAETVAIEGGTIKGEVKALTPEHNIAISGGTFTVEPKADYVADGFTCEQNEDGTYGIVEAKVYLAEVEGVKYETVADALAAAKEAGVTDLVITLIGETTEESAIALEDSFYLYMETAFNSVTFKQEDATKTYWIDSIYTGSRINGGKFVFDGVNICVTGQYIFEGNVRLINNSVVERSNDVKNFIYYGDVTIEPGSQVKSQIDDILAGYITVDGGKTDGYTEAPGFHSIYFDVRAGQTFTLKNGAYAKLNAADEIGRLTLNGNAVVTASKMDVLNNIVMGENAWLQTDVNSQITAKVITGAGVITIDATGFEGDSAQVIKADMSGFEGDITVTDGYVFTSDATGVTVTKAAKQPSGKIAYRAYINDSATREAVTVDLQNVYAEESVVVKLYDAVGNLLTTTTLKAGGADVPEYLTTSIVLWHDNDASGSWDTEIHAAKLTVANVPTKGELWIDGELMDTFEDILGKSTDAAAYQLPAYLALDCVYKEAQIGETYYATLADAIDNAENGDTIVLLNNIELSEMIANNKTITIDLNGKTVAGTDTTAKNFSMIDNRGDLTITDSAGGGKMTLTATVNSGWSRYSAVIANNPGGKFALESGTLEHLGGTDMAYGIDNLTNGKGTYAETVVNGGTVKSPYRAIRQFLNGVEAQNILTVNGGTIEGANKSIWMQDPSKNANTGTLTVGENAVLKGDVYLFVTAGSTEWPVEVSIAADALDGESTVLTGNVPEGYEVKLTDGTYGVTKVVVPEATLKLDGLNLRLQDLLRLGFYFTVETDETPDEVGALMWTAEEYAAETDYTVTSTVADNVAAQETTKVNRYIVESEGIFAQHLDTVYYIIPYVVIDGEYVYGEAKSSSALVYAQMAYADQDENLRSIVVDLLNYATAARAYFCITENLPAPEKAFNSIINESERVVNWSDSLKAGYPTVVETEGEYNPGFRSLKTNLNEAIKLHFIFEGSVSGVGYWNEEEYAALSVHNKENMANEATMTFADNYRYGTLENLYSFHMYDNFYVMAYNEAGQCSRTYGASVASYLSTLIDQYSASATEEDQSLVALTKAMLVYGDNAMNNPIVNKGNN